MRKKNDFNHIYIAELDAVLKEINLSLMWCLKEIEMRKDSVTILNSVLTPKKRVRSKGAAEVIIKGRCGILGELIYGFSLKLCASFVPCERNKADTLTRMKTKCLELREKKGSVADMCYFNYSVVK